MDWLFGEHNSRKLKSKDTVGNRGDFGYKQLRGGR